MWVILAKILAVIGIILLCLLGLILLTVLLILFAPLRYKGKASKHGSDINAIIKVHWLFGILRLYYFYPDPGKPEIKFLFFSLLKDKKSKNFINESEDISIPTETSLEPSNNIENQNEDKQNNDEKPIDDIPEETETDSEDDSQDARSNKLIEKIKNIFYKIKYTIHSIYDKIVHIFNNISYYVSLIQDENTKLVWNDLKARFIKILKSIRPRKIKGNVTIGTGDPDSTGKIYGLYCVLNSIWKMNVSYQPDFDNRMIEGDLEVKGRIYCFVLLHHGLKVFFDKRLRKLIRSLKAGTGGNENG